MDLPVTPDPVGDGGARKRRHPRVSGPYYDDSLIRKNTTTSKGVVVNQGTPTDFVGCLRDAISGECSWLHSEFPSLWNTPGGDFNSDPNGQLSPSSQYTDGTVFEFPLNVNEVQRIIDNDTPYFGFILKDDDNTGNVQYYLREWNLLGFKPSRSPPQLVLEMSATANPPASPTRAPTTQPTERLLEEL